MNVIAVVLEVGCLGVLAAGLGVAAATDLACRIVPNGCVAAVALSGAARTLVAATLGGRGAAAVLSAVLGAALVFAIMVSAALLSARGREGPGVGGGDVKLLAAVGVWTGPVGGLVAIGLSCLVGLVGWAIGAARAPKGAVARGIPLAPAIAIAALPIAVVGLPPIAVTL